MIGIKEIASYIPENRFSNYDRKTEFHIDDHFIEEKVGVKFLAVKDKDDDTSDLCVKAFDNLLKKSLLDKATIEVVVVVTQNPDKLIPHTSAIVHDKLDLSKRCASFDISQGCPGYVYGLSIIISFMKENGLTKGLLFTADPYSKIINKHDKNTALLFGDASTVTLISDDPSHALGKCMFSTIGKDHMALYEKNGRLYMNGRAIVNFAAKTVPQQIKALLRVSDIKLKDVDKLILHQGSKFIVDTITKRLGIDEQKTIFDISDYGNTVSSSIPIILEKQLHNDQLKRIVISGFGVGLSSASAILLKEKSPTHVYPNAAKA